MIKKKLIKAKNACNDKKLGKCNLKKMPKLKKYLKIKLNKNRTLKQLL